jgi:uncharacterized membrane protein YfcA
MLDPQYIVYLGLIVSFAAFVQGFTGLGFGIVAITGLAFTPWDLERGSVVINVLLVILNCTIVYAGRKESKIKWKLVGVILTGEIIGVPVGYWFIVTYGNQAIFRFVLGVVLIIFAIYTLFRPRIRTEMHLSLGVIAGVFGGFLAGAFTAGGPPMALFLYSRFKNPKDAKGTLQIVFMAATLCRLFYIIFFGNGVSLEIMRIVGISFPFVIVFATIGHFFTKKFSSDVFLRVVYSFIAFAGVLNILKIFK